MKRRGCSAWLVVGSVLVAINIGVCLYAWATLMPQGGGGGGGRSSRDLGVDGDRRGNRAGDPRWEQQSNGGQGQLEQLPRHGYRGRHTKRVVVAHDRGDEDDDDLMRAWRQLLTDNQAQPKQHTVEVWSKAAIGTYFQEHIMQTVIEPRLNGVWFFSQGQCPRVKLNFRSGPGVIPQKVPHNAKHVVLILNGHNEEKIPTAKQWLDLLPQLPHLEAVGLVVLAQEDCTNHWLRPYLEDEGRFKIKFAFMVYGGKDWVDGVRVQQWPLGVATYRKFPRAINYLAAVGPNPNITITAVRKTRRKYLCNLQATIYEGSSRETLLQVLRASGLAKDCFINARTQWLPNETPETAEEYKQMLLESEYTLAPAGLNTECYRWYEAAAAGSTPIVEDVIQPKTCGRDPLALLKELEAPFIYVKDWRDLPAVLEREQRKTPQQLFQQRVALVTWYEDFKVRMRGRFCSTLAHAFGLH
ncbi:hypothetical protein PTSG_08361 [Salpingoeca rosetta]|uniref:Transmembrane protein 5 n=1 Tax=Salpingoeca rosetta (strain ATCC 50818 / BSB-021) TaxID=946362 RepID=F2UJG8_SALR5|nr:uncharacterized protein PTSG_08361 [Salpingoeca rosetta]EGD77267.1 hypothetical protein PTSG_08361 [Salpingoeca rosetta]|eukprot:XP_004990611.1 hypothetical protein PTSG_08361 [Salpingoeca rosetta]